MVSRVLVGTTRHPYLQRERMRLAASLRLLPGFDSQHLIQSRDLEQATRRGRRVANGEGMPERPYLLMERNQ